MKPWILWLVLVWNLGALPIQDHPLDRAALRQLANVLGVTPEEDLVTATQVKWLRRPTQERWEMDLLSLEQDEQVLAWAAAHNLLAPWVPTQSSYDKALILGATVPHMQIRLHYLEQLWHSGVRFQEVVWLTGQRPLDPQADGFLDCCSSESEAAHLLWDKEPLPDEMRALPVTFVEVPMKSEGRRPNTQDTIVAWANTVDPCRALFISEQPFCGYQFAVIDGSLPSSFAFDVVGPGQTLDAHPALSGMTLDSLARWLYQETKNQQP
jgi:hypothetical protein